MVQVDSESGRPSSDLFGGIIDRHERRFRTVGDMVYHVLREGILQGVFPTGEYLRQDYLAEAIGVSRIPVRSALMQLEVEGLITFHPYRGAMVNQITGDEMAEIYEMRALLEATAIRKAFAAMTPERLAELEQAARQLNDVEDAAEFLRGRNDFFASLYDVEHHPRLVAVIEKLREDAGRYWLQRHPRDGYVRPPGQRDHQEVLRFLRAGDVEGAVSWLESHLAQVASELVTIMQEEASASSDEKAEKARKG
jgi:DNA-binding GntR family transcriptional regulator